MGKDNISEEHIKKLAIFAKGIKEDFKKDTLKLPFWIIDAFNGAQGRILYVLWQEDGISIRSLSTKCGLAITSLTTMLERMENQGLISRVQSETDKRKTLMFLTEKAHDLKGEYDSVSDEMSSIYYKGFSEEEITRFEECLDRIRKNLEEWQK